MSLGPQHRLKIPLSSENADWGRQGGSHTSKGVRWKRSRQLASTPLSISHWQTEKAPSAAATCLQAIWRVVSTAKNVGLATWLLLNRSRLGRRVTILYFFSKWARLLGMRRSLWRQYCDHVGALWCRTNDQDTAGPSAHGGARACTTLQSVLQRVNH